MKGLFSDIEKYSDEKLIDDIAGTTNMRLFHVSRTRAGWLYERSGA